MSDLHDVYLNLGSNVESEKNVPNAILLLSDVGEIKEVSSVWETESVGYAGANFLNVCVLFITPLEPEEIKREIIRPIEAQLGRIRSLDKNAPRPIDIDIVLFDETPHNLQMWNQAFVIVPLAEVLPEFQHPVLNEKLANFSDLLKNQVWIQKKLLNIKGP